MENETTQSAANTSLQTFKAELSSKSQFSQQSIKHCDPGHVYVINDLPGQTIIKVEFVIDIVGPQDVFGAYIKADRTIHTGSYLPILLPVTDADRLGQLRNFKFSANPGGIVIVEQMVGEAGKTYSWHVIWVHNSLSNP